MMTDRPKGPHSRLARLERQMAEHSTLNLNNPNVKEEDLTVDEIRDDTDELRDKIYGWLDEVQGDVSAGKHETAYLVIKVTK